MRIQLLPLPLLLLALCVSVVEAQEPAARRSAPAAPDVSMSEVKPTPEMWFYLQERQRHESPKYLVRRNAEIDAHRRSERLAMQRWLGQSSERPTCYASILGGVYPGTFPYGGADRWNYYYLLQGHVTQPPSK